MKIVGYYVTKGGVPCAFCNAIGSYRGGLLVPVADLVKVNPRSRKLPAAAFFNKQRDARRAMNRSNAAAQSLLGAAHWVKEAAARHAPSYFDGTPFAIWPLAKQLAGLPAERKVQESVPVVAPAAGTPAPKKKRRAA